MENAWEHNIFRKLHLFSKHIFSVYSVSGSLLGNREIKTKATNPTHKEPEVAHIPVWEVLSCTSTKVKTLNRACYFALTFSRKSYIFALHI